MDLETFEELKKEIKAFDIFVSKVNEKNILTVFQIPYVHLETVFSYFDETEIGDKISNYQLYASSILESYNEFASALEKKETIIRLMDEERNKQLRDFLSKVYEASKEELALLKKDLIDATEMKGILDCVNDLMEKEEYIPINYIDRLFKIHEKHSKTEYFDTELRDILLLLISHNQHIVEEKREEIANKKVASVENQEGQKRKRYIETYNLPLDETVSLETIEEVIKESYMIGIEFLQKNPSCFTNNKDLYLSNIKLLRKRNIDLEVVSDRDPDAFLSPNLKENITLITNYKIDITELLCYQEHALTDLSYFTVLDQMIENDMFDIRLLLDKQNTKVRKRTVLRLLGVPKMEIKGDFPLSEEEIAYLLEVEKVEPKQGRALFKENILDSYKVDDRTYDISGIRISRPKILRNSKSIQDVSLETILSGSYFNEEEKCQIKETISSLTYQKRK